MIMQTTLGRVSIEGSLIHRLDPRAKLLATLVLTAGLFLANTYSSLLALAVFVAVLCAVSRFPLKSISSAVRPILITLAGVSLLHLFASPGPYLAELGPLKLSEPGLVEAGKIDLRLASVLVLAALISWATSPMALTEGIERSLSPLARFGLPVHELAMSVGIALRFVPTTVAELQRLMKAQAARGVDFSTGGPLRRARALVPLVIPLIVATLERAEELAVAMESRCYRGSGRSRFHQLQFTALDGLAVACCIGLVATLLLFLQ